jgi:NADPH:quinone reductase
VAYGAAGAVGAFAVQLAKKAGIRPLICIAGNGIPFVEGLIEKGDTIIDYRKADEAVVEDIRAAVPHGTKLMYAFDAVSEKGSTAKISQVLSTEGGKITTVLRVDGKFPDGQEIGLTSVASVNGDKTRGDVARDNAFGFAYLRLFGYGLKEGWFNPHPHHVVPGGLGGIEQASTNRKNGKARAVKYVFGIADTNHKQVVEMR